MVPIDYKNNPYLADLRKYILIQSKNKSNSFQKIYRLINKLNLRRNKIKKPRKKDKIL